MTIEQLQAMTPGDIVYGLGLPPKELRFYNRPPDGKWYYVWDDEYNIRRRMHALHFAKYFPTALQSLRYQLVIAQINVMKIEESYNKAKPVSSITGYAFSATHWQVRCPNPKCRWGYETNGVHDSSAVTECKCGTSFRVSRIELGDDDDDDNYTE